MFWILPEILAKFDGPLQQNNLSKTYEIEKSSIKAPYRTHWTKD